MLSAFLSKLCWSFVRCQTSLRKKLFVVIVDMDKLRLLVLNYLHNSSDANHFLHAGCQSKLFCHLVVTNNTLMEHLSKINLLQMHCSKPFSHYLTHMVWNNKHQLNVQPYIVRCSSFVRTNYVYDELLDDVDTVVVAFNLSDAISVVEGDYNKTIGFNILY